MADRDDATNLYEQGMIVRVPNAPKTPIRGFRIPDDDYREFQGWCESEGSDASSVIRRLVRQYNRKMRRRAQESGEGG